ncbi:hypothetical protein WMY93_005542 [Mugilogobius chulae]|uniref:Uncharacterized protein n=1 Tax=Mugilogobius chulae TaxID=88201 RepID=A0AAW0PR27_9GOBI
MLSQFVEARRKTSFFCPAGGGRSVYPLPLSFCLSSSAHSSSADSSLLDKYHRAPGVCTSVREVHECCQTVKENTSCCKLCVQCHITATSLTECWVLSKVGQFKEL